MDHQIALIRSYFLLPNFNLSSWGESTAWEVFAVAKRNEALLRILLTDPNVAERARSVPPSQESADKDASIKRLTVELGVCRAMVERLKAEMQEKDVALQKLKSDAEKMQEEASLASAKSLEDDEALAHMQRELKAQSKECEALRRTLAQLRRDSDERLDAHRAESTLALAKDKEQQRQLHELKRVQKEHEEEITGLRATLDRHRRAVTQTTGTQSSLVMTTDVDAQTAQHNIQPLSLDANTQTSPEEDDELYRLRLEDGRGREQRESSDNDVLTRWQLAQVQLELAQMKAERDVLQRALDGFIPRAVLIDTSHPDISKCGSLWRREGNTLEYRPTQARSLCRLFLEPDGMTWTLAYAPGGGVRSSALHWAAPPHLRDIDFDETAGATLSLRAVDDPNAAAP